jgi:RNA polymerase sigma-70 factor (ECF subfamily)
MDSFLTEIERYRNQFFRFILRNLWDTSQADDVFASAVLVAWENRHKFTPGTNFRAWVFRILVNKCFVANRETKRAFEPLDDETVESVALDWSPAKPATDAEIGASIATDEAGFLEQCGDEIYAAFQRLSTAQRSCILLKDVEHFSYQEIAEILEIPVGTVMTHLARGRAKLRTDLLAYARQRGIVRADTRRDSAEKNAEQSGDEKNVINGAQWFPPRRKT